MKLWMIAALLLFMPRPATAVDSPPGTPVSGMKLLDMKGHTVEYWPRKGVTVIMFFSTRCPMSNAFNYRRNQLYSDFKGRVRFFVVDPNVNEPLAEVRQYAEDTGFDFPVYKDVNNALTDRLGVRATTDTFLIDPSGTIRYRGYVEDAPNPARSTKRPLRDAIAAVLNHQPVTVAETRPIGCAIRRVKP